MLILLRHGQSDANARGVLVGRTDASLTPLGVQQSQASSTAVPPGARIVSSPLSRARATAGHAAPGFPVGIDDRWIEMDYGSFDGRLMSELPDGVASAWRADPCFAPPGGESLVDVGQRVRAALDEMRDEIAGGDVVVVSHVSPIKAALVWALGVSDETAWRMYLAPASVSRIAVHRDGSTSVVSMNDTAHLRTIC